MPVDPISLASTIISGAGMIGDMIANPIQNKKGRQFAEKMYQKQLDDNIRLNSPRAMMQRYQEAGLNPHLIYGQGNTFDVPRPPSWEPTPFKTGAQNVADSLQNYAAIRSSNAQADLTQQALQLQKQDILLRSLQAMEKLLDIDVKGVDLKFKKETYIDSVQMFKQNLQKLTQETDANIPEHQKNKLLADTQVTWEDYILKQLQQKKTKVDTQYVQQQIKSQRLKDVMQAIENKMAKDGIFKSDPLYMRVLQSGADAIANGKTDNWIAKMWDWINK